MLKFDSFEDHSNFYIFVDLPGIANEKDIKILTNKSTITIETQRSRQQISGAKSLKLKRSYGSVKQVIKLSRKEKVIKKLSEYKNGVLYIELEKLY